MCQREGKMETSSDYRVGSTAQLRSIIGEPGELAPKKVMRALDEMAADFIHRSPFLVLATTDAEGNLDASPKGGAPGFVAVEDEQTLAIPDRKGNKLIFGLQNILADPHVGLIFMIPGTDETLRVNGAAELTVEPALLDRLAERGAPAHVAIRVHVHECFFHCAKAFIRSQLWHPDSWQARQKISWGKYFASKVGLSQEAAIKLDEMVENDYKHNL
jgi:PPOX class probable FMN-dependent enzyme